MGGCRVSDSVEVLLSGASCSGVFLLSFDLFGILCVLFRFVWISTFLCRWINLTLGNLGDWRLDIGGLLKKSEQLVCRESVSFYMYLLAPAARTIVKLSVYLEYTESA